MRNALLLASICLALAGLAAPAQAYTLVSREHGFRSSCRASRTTTAAHDLHATRSTTGSAGTTNATRFIFKLTPKMGGARVLGDLINEKGRCKVVESDKPIRQGGVTGRDALIRDTKYTHRHGCGFRRFSLRVRGFVVGNRFYWVQYKIYSKDDAMDPEVTRVFDSFRVLN